MAALHCLLGGRGRAAKRIGRKSDGNHDRRNWPGRTHHSPKLDCLSVRVKCVTIQTAEVYCFDGRAFWENDIAEMLAQWTRGFFAPYDTPTSPPLPLGQKSALIQGHHEAARGANGQPTQPSLSSSNLASRR
jgi:hypothetical protein